MVSLLSLSLERATIIIENSGKYSRSATILLATSTLQEKCSRRALGSDVYALLQTT